MSSNHPFDSAKYPLSILNKLKDVLPGRKLLGYDIGCAFKKTIASSSIGDSLNAETTIPALHAFGHHRGCQEENHPHYKKGTGIEDFEGCERFFSASNDCARTTRHSTAFHRHQIIDNFISYWDSEKYASLGSFIHNNYRQSLRIIQENTDTLRRLMPVYGIASEAVFKTWLKEEATYLAGLSKEPEEDTLAVAYVLALEELWKAETELATQTKSVASPVVTSKDPEKRTVHRTYRAACEKVERCMEVVNNLEAELDVVGPRWTRESPKYKEAAKFASERKYRLALDRIERLLVQRIFELQKGHLHNTGTSPPSFGTQ